MKKIKSLTGGDMKRTRGAYEKTTFSWVPKGVPILSCNRTPRLKDDDIGTRRRLWFIPLEVSLKDLPKAQQRTQAEVDSVHRREASGILNWFIDGWRAYCVDGLNAPNDWINLRDRLLEGADPVTQFLKENTDRAEKGRIKRSDLNKVFKMWSEEEGAANWSSNAVNNGLRERSFVERRITGDFYWLGLRWKTDAFDLVERATGNRPAAPTSPPNDRPAF